MGHYFCHGSCANCGNFMSFNPNYVPSISINGKKHQICSACHAKWNEIHRTSKGLEPLPLHPQAFEPERCD